MSKLVIHIDNHDQKFTVREMRKRLAQVLSKLNGDQEVSFTFVATLENYRPEPSPVKSYGKTYHENLMQTALYGELARPEND